VLVRFAVAITLGLVSFTLHVVAPQDVVLADPGSGDGPAQVSTTDTLTPSVANDYDGTIRALIRAAAQRHGADPELLLAIAVCESRLKPGARGPDGASGMFQIAPTTWIWAAEQAGLAGASAFDPIASSEVAAWLLKHVGPKEWGCP
jgi:soluble lytic murein transglycosylase-like protein